MLNNFSGRFFRKASTIFGARVKKGLLIKKGLLGNTKTDAANGSLKLLAMLLKYLNNFWRSLEMSFFKQIGYCKAKAKLNWRNHFVFSVTSVYNDYPNSTNMTFTINNIELYVLAVSSSAKDNRLSKIDNAKKYKVKTYYLL